MLRLFLFIALAGAVLAPARAQAPGANYMELGAAMQAAQAAAVRPGDESLDCDALEKELTAAARDPALQSRIQASAEAEQARAATSSAPSPATAAAVTLFSSLVPGGDMAGIAAGAAQAPSQQAQAAGNVQMRAQQMQSMMANLPVLMRGQRVMELAQARNCDWASGSQSR